VNKLFVFCGIPFSGKTTISKLIVKKPNYVRIDLDEVKADLVGENIRDEDVSQNEWDRVYQEMYQKIEINLKEGKNVLQDAGNFTKYERGLVRETADKLGLETIVVYINTPIAVARKRLLENKQTRARADVNEELFDQVIKEMEPPNENETNISYTPGKDLNQWINEHFS